MSNYAVATLCSHSVAIAAIAGAIRYRYIDAAYRPFVFFLFLATANELLSTWLIYHHYNSSVNGNVYVLLEFLLIVQLFRRWGVAVHKQRVYVIMTTVMILVWLTDNFVTGRITTVNVLYRLASSMVLIFFSVDQMNRLLIAEQQSAYKNARFTICAGFILFYTFKAFLESFFLFKLQLSNDFFEGFLLVLVIVNVIANLIYIMAVLWMPTKEEFSLPY